MGIVWQRYSFVSLLAAKIIGLIQPVHFKDDIPSSPFAVVTVNSFYFAPPTARAPMGPSSSRPSTSSFSDTDPQLENERSDPLDGRSAYVEMVYFYLRQPRTRWMVEPHARPILEYIASENWPAVLSYS